MLETTPTTQPPVLAQEVLCSCVKGVRNFIPTMPYGDANNVFSNSELFIGVVAIFWFPPSKTYPKGTKHVAYVDQIKGNSFHIKQTNKQTCQYTEEWISFDDPNLLGFYNPVLDTLDDL